MIFGEVVNRVNFEAVFNSLPTPTMVMDADFNIVAMNEAYLEVTGRERDSLLGVNVFEAFPAEGESRRRLQESFERVRDEGVADVLPVLHYPIAGVDGPEQRSWSCTHVPILDADGKVAFLVQNTQDITKYQLPGEEAASAGDGRSGVQGRLEMIEVLNQTVLATAHHLDRLFMQASNFMCVLRGPDHVYEMANVAMRDLLGGREVIGKSMCEALPELESQGVIEILNNVVATGEAFASRKMRLFLQNAKGQIQEFFLDIVCQPIVDEKSEISGLFVEGCDVTAHVRS